MSRFYHLHVQVQGISKAQFEDTMSELGWDSISIPFLHKKVLDCTFCGNLCGGQSEKQAHNEISMSLKALTNKRVKVRTRFTYMEDLPHEEYGDLF